MKKIQKVNFKNNSISKLVFLFLIFGLGFILGLIINRPSNLQIKSRLKDNIEWASTNILGRGITFKYPIGWHVAIYNNKVAINPKPVSVNPIGARTEGPLGQLVISVIDTQNNPQAELNQLVKDTKAGLTDITEEILSSKYFEKIYHIKGIIYGEIINGKAVGDMEAGGMPRELFFLLQTNPKYISSDNINSQSIITVESDPLKSEYNQISQDIVFSIKECHKIDCESE